MDYDWFYKRLFAPIEERIGPIDETIIGAIIGFDCGGPIRLSTVGRGRQRFVTYVTCELAFREEQLPSASGRFEAMLDCDDEDWARKILTKVGQMSLDSTFGHGHTVDIGPVVAPDCPIQGLAVQEFARVTIDDADFALFQFHGVTRPELEFAIEFDVEQLLNKLRDADLYPKTSVHRQGSVAKAD